ncbi:MAG: TetR/AcrR family transcriptional regulator [Sphingomonadaceae bacterium]|jgi:AcrR family transcriptional regulator
MAGEPRRVGAETSETRSRILKATEALLRDEGYGALSTRRVAARAGLKPSLVHYYFPTTDDLLLAVSREGAEDSDRMIEQAMASDDPIAALWRFYIDTSRTAMALEFMAMANHRPALREHMAQHCKQMRVQEAKIFRALLGDRIDTIEGLTPEVLSVVLVGIGRAIVMEDNLGLDDGHEAAKKFVAGWLKRMSEKA